MQYPAPDFKPATLTARRPTQVGPCRGQTDILIRNYVLIS
jgi:hypothetical protein